jgi:hypothetical protein
MEDTGRDEGTLSGRRLALQAIELGSQARAWEEIVHWLASTDVLEPLRLGDQVSWK